MTKYNAKNERIKRDYFTLLKEAKGQSSDAVDAAATAIARFESMTRFRDFKAFHFEQAVAFKRHLAEQDSHVTGKKLSKATVTATLAQLKRFFQWLAWMPGYKTKLRYQDADYFNPSDKDLRVASARRQRPVPTLEQIRHLLDTMPTRTAIDRRNRALVALTLLTGARDSAIASMKCKHLDLIADFVFQDAREVKTKFSKTFTTYFFPVGDDVRQIVADWFAYLRDDLLFGNDDPLFPATKVGLGPTHQFEPVGLDRKHWSNAGPIRSIFKAAFAAADLPYFNPHSFRNTLVGLGEKLCRNAEEFKAWSQNMGHEGVLTTFTSYGEVSALRQADIIGGFSKPKEDPEASAESNVRAVILKMVASGELAVGA
jgi:integrase/recombinase XerD